MCLLTRSIVSKLCFYVRGLIGTETPGSCRFLLCVFLDSTYLASINLRAKLRDKVVTSPLWASFCGHRTIILQTLQPVTSPYSQPSPSPNSLQANILLPYSPSTSKHPTGDGLVVQSLPTLFKLARPKLLPPPCLVFLWKTIKVLGHTFPSLLLPAGPNLRFAMWSCGAWCVPFSWEM